MTPPRLARRLLRAVMPVRLRDEVIADLDQEFRQHVVPSRSSRSARAWYWRQVLGSLPAALRMARGWLVDLRADFRYGVRLLARQPGFAAATILTLALGVAGSTAVCTVINSVLLRPLPYEAPDRLMSVDEFDTRRDESSGNASYPDFLDYRDRNTTFTQIAGHNGGSRTLTGAGPADRLSMSEVTNGFFQVLGVRPALGRDFTAADSLDGAPPVVILSDGAWQRRFGSNPHIIGRVIALSGQATTIVGVLPRAFKFPGRAQAEIWLPALPSAAQIGRRYQHWLNLIGRLRPEVTQAQAADDLARVARGISEQDPVGHQHSRVVVSALGDRIVGPLRPMLLVLLAASGLLLAASCASAGGLLVARGTRRLREMSVRAAIGGSGSRLVRQLLAEGLAIAIPGALVGALLGQLLVRLFLTSLPARQRDSLTASGDVGIDVTVLVALTMLTVVVAVGVSLVPAWQASRASGAQALRLRDGTVAPGRLGGLFVGLQVAMAVVLLVGAGLLTRSIRELTKVSPGFSPDGLVTMRATLSPTSNRTPATATLFHSEMLRALAALPGVSGAATINELPLSGRSPSGTFKIHGGDPSVEHQTLIRTISPNYFQVMGIGLQEGRSFDDGDRAGAERVVIVNQVAADTILGGAPIGRQISFRFFDGQPWSRVVGVVGNEQFVAIDQPLLPVVYFPYATTFGADFGVVVRTAGEPDSVTRVARARLNTLDSVMSVYAATTLPRMLADSDPMFRRRAVLRLVAGFALIAMLLATVGVYATVAQSVVHRAREIGVRVALGARRSLVFRDVIGRGLSPVLAGLIVGLAVSLLAAPALGSLLFGVNPSDPPTFVAVTIALAAVAAAACLLPANRATRVDPAVVLRE